MEAQQEIWKDVVGYEGKYQVSNYGRVKSLDRIIKYADGRKHIHKGKVLIPRLKSNGYTKVGLPNNPDVTIHQLVAKAFVPNPQCKPEIDHINGVRSDNRSCNLRWVTRSENLLNPICLRRMSDSMKGKKHSKEMNIAKSKRQFNKPRRTSRRVIKFTNDGKYIETFDMIAQAARSVMKGDTHIRMCCNGFRKSAYGFKWKWEDIE